MTLTPEQIAAIWEQAKLLAMFAAFIAVGLGSTDYFKEFFQTSFVQRVVISIRTRLTAHLLRLSMRFFSRQRMGDIYSRLTNDVQQTQLALTFLFGDLVEDVLMLIGLSAVCLIASPLLFIGLIVVGPLVVLPIASLGQKLRKRSRTRQVFMAGVTESMQQMLTGIRTVKAFGREEHELARFAERNEDLFQQGLKVTRARAMARAVLETINHGIVPLIFLGGIWMVREGHLHPGNLAWFVAALVRMYPPAKRLTRSYSNLQESLAGLDRLEEVLKQDTEVGDAPDATPLGSVRGELALRNVSFAYGSEAVLREVSLQAKPGEVVALVGPSGGGKSTILDLIARFYDPESGSVEVDGRDLRKVTRASLVDAIAIVTQDPFLFNDSVAANVRYARQSATLDEVVAACKAANIHDVIAALPQGYGTVVGERGATLSGGQRQRVTIARALLKDPRILLLDEATSALDTESERVVQEALERLMKGRTTVVVAHRLSTVIGATRIVVVDRGRIVEEGTHEELVQRGGLYAKLYTLQAA